MRDKTFHICESVLSLEEAHKSFFFLQKEENKTVLQNGRPLKMYQISIVSIHLILKSINFYKCVNFGI